MFLPSRRSEVVPSEAVEYRVESSESIIPREMPMAKRWYRHNGIRSVQPASFVNLKACIMHASWSQEPKRDQASRENRTRDLWLLYIPPKEIASYQLRLTLLLLKSIGENKDRE
uniref:Uncharacterized protein n=1 Tax=Solanum lycopersicum TaxID=4081 RepID=A0A3Q7H7T2_SOLLC